MADTITGTQLATKQTLISSMVQKELAFKAKLTNLITDVTAMAVPGADTIKFPKLTSFTVVNRSEGVSGERSALTSSVDTLSLDQNAYVSWGIDSMTVMQNNINAELEFAKFAAAAQARYVDTAIIAKIRSVAASFINVGADVDATYANLLTLLEAIETADGDPTSCAWIMSPHQKNVLMGLAEFKNSYQFGQANIPAGQFYAPILGCPVYVHNGLASKELFLVEKSALAIGFQKGASYDEQKDVTLGVNGKRAVVDQLFGVCGLQLGLKGAGAGKSPLVAGLND
jgi:hypothetical protein